MTRKDKPRVRVAKRRLRHSCQICGMRILKNERYLIASGEYLHETCSQKEIHKKLSNKKGLTEFPVCHGCGSQIKKVEDIGVVVTKKEQNLIYCKKEECKNKAFLD